MTPDQHSRNDPPVAVLLALYNPPADWLGQLLDSLREQTYRNLKIYIRDDASDRLPPEGLESFVARRLDGIPFRLFRNERNLGSNGTFAALVRDAQEELIAFCDQDDVWLPDKVERSVRLFCQSPLHPVLVCSEASVIDADGRELSPLISRHRKRHVFLRGAGLADKLIYRNFAMGCTMLLRREWALSLLPFPDGIVHDHYIAFRAACDGAIDYLPEPTIRYRVYGGNQTGVMTGIRSKEDYFRRRIAVFGKRIAEFSRYTDLPALKEAREWCDARVANYERKKGAFRRLFALRRVNRSTTWFELLALRFPALLFRIAIRLVQKRVL